MSRKKQEAKSEASMARTLEAAQALFSRQGFGATSMREIAREAGLSVGNVYHHFPNKEALFERLLADYWERLLDPESPLTKLFQRAEFPDDLTEMAYAIEEVVTANKESILLIYVDVIEFKGAHLRNFYSGMAERFRAVYGERLAARQAAGELGDIDPLVGVMTAVRWFFYFFTVEKCFGISTHLGLPEEKAVDEFVRLFRYGLLPRSPGSPSPKGEPGGAEPSNGRAGAREET